MFHEIISKYDADYVIVKENETYLCYLNPDLQEDKTREINVLNQNCWRIVQISQTTQNNYTTIMRKYPNGDAYNYTYAPKHIDEYEFEYRK